MEIIIEHGKTKRKIEGSFNICLSAEDLKTIANTLNKHFIDGHVYGWIEISDKQKPNDGVKPKGWDD